MLTRAATALSRTKIFIDPQSPLHRLPRHDSCTCACGAPLLRPLGSRRSRMPSSSPFSSSSSRHARASPSIRRTKRLSKDVTLYDKRQRTQVHEEWNAHGLTQDLINDYMLDDMGLNSQQVVGFLNAFSEAVGPSSQPRPLEKSQWQCLVQEWLGERVWAEEEAGGKGSQDLWMLMRRLLIRGVGGDRVVGRHMLYTMSAAGNVSATIHIMSHALIGSKLHRNLVESSAVAGPRRHLRAVAEAGGDFRAMVLEGKIAYQVGNEERALSMWSGAIAAAVHASDAVMEERARNRRRRGQRGRWRELLEHTEHTTPWIELTMLHFERYQARLAAPQRYTLAQTMGELERARAACELGCAQDDPTSHFHMAQLFRESHADGSPRYTSSWLYHITKAAASRHVIAAHTLAQWYADSAWKYIEDEPPDHIKPTPFDSYPAPPRPFLATLLGGPPNGADGAPVLDPKHAIFHTAASPATPQPRQSIAFAWLRLALQLNYAPSCLLAAKMLLEETLQGQAATPPAALNLRPARYSHASKADWKANRPLPADRRPSPAAGDVPNPVYSPDQAKHYLTLAIHAVRASRIRARIVKDLEFERDGSIFQKVSSLDRDYKVHSLDEYPEITRRWWQNDDVRALWDDPTQVRALEEEVRGICDRKGWELRDEQGGLLYKPGMRGFVTAHEPMAAAAAAKS